MNKDTHVWLNAMSNFVLHILFVSILVLLGNGNSQHSEENSSIEGNRRNLILKVFPVADLGTSSLVSEHVVYGALIKTWESKEFFPLKFREFINETNIYQIRSALYDQMRPIPMLQWPAIEYRPCPTFSQNGGHRNERGHGASHLQVWLEFSFFDHDVNEARFRFRPEYISSSSYSSVSSTFQALENGTLLRNGQQYKDDDFIFLFEDAVQTTQFFNLTELIRDIQKSEPFDILPLMNCSQTRQQMISNSGITSHHLNKHKSFTSEHLLQGGTSNICLAAYAIKRKAARSLGRLVDICGRRIEQQLSSFAMEEFITIGQFAGRAPYFVDYGPL
jgi:hypothetical protein